MSVQSYRTRLSGAWRWLSQAPDSVPESTRRQVRLVAGVGLSLLAILLFVSGYLLFQAQFEQGPMGIEAYLFSGRGLVVMAAVGINRRGQSQLAAGLVLLTTAVDAWGALLINRSTSSGGESLFYPLVTIILCGLLLPIWATAIVTI